MKSSRSWMGGAAPRPETGSLLLHDVVSSGRVSASRGVGRTALVGLVAACISCGADGPTATEHTGRSVHAVGDGTEDTANGFSGVARLGTGTGTCTAVLATKRFVVTAGHCFAGPITDLNASLTFAYDPSTVPAQDPRRVMHTRAASGPVQARRTEIDGGNDGHRAQDVAVVRLDTLVPPSVATPIRPAGLTAPSNSLSVPGCGNTFQRGTLVGYGPREDGASNPGTRNFSVTSDWDRERIAGAGEIFVNEFFFTDTYRGGLSGDSGGPLLRVGFDQTVVCGVHSGRNSDPFYTTSKSAALDSGLTNAFLQNILVNKFGAIIGEQPGFDTRRRWGVGRG